MKNPRYANERGGILLDTDDGGLFYADAGPVYDAAIAGQFGPIAPFVPPPPPSPEEALAEERAAMVCSPSQMRLALHRAGLLAAVQAISDGDPEASIVWEYATQIVRTSPLIDAMGGPNGFTPEQIDDLFRAAMAIQV
jgi:hypothetical protein